MDFEYDVDYKAVATRFGKAVGLGDDTWKERHAKGVPVKITIEQFSKCTDTGYLFGIIRYFNSGYPVARAERHSNRYAVFCNFRYKQSWLDKQELTKINEGLEKFYNSVEWTGKKGGDNAK